jgi:O-antigen ligase
VPEGLARTSHRELVYIGDLLLGLSTVGLVLGLRAGGFDLRRLIWGLIAGVVACALYAVYQWPAQHFGWPAADIVNTVNSDGFSVGHRFQGAGLLGWERARGTFKEPLFLASYLAAVAPVLVAAAVGARSRVRRALVAGLAVCALALAVTVSSLTWGLAVVTTLAFVAAWAVVTRRPRAATAAGALAIGAILVAPLVFVHPDVASGITGREVAALQTTSSVRRQAWEQAAQAWAPQPLLGHGPGQSSILLAYRPNPVPVHARSAPLVLGAAQGVWAATLLDAGLAGLLAWVLTLGSLFLVGMRALARRASTLTWAATGAAALAVLSAQFAGDRFDLKVWVLLGLMVAVAGGARAPSRPTVTAERPVGSTSDAAEGAS